MPRHARDPIREVVREGLCIGCGACCLALLQGSVRMQESANGFIEPTTNGIGASRQERARFRSICPGREVRGPDERNSLLWGPLLGTYAGHAANPVLRHSAASGGALTAICAHLLDSGLVDAVATLRTDARHPLRPVSGLVRSSADLAGTEGSRYCPSSPVEILSATEPAERVAFVGKPCDVAAVRQLASAGVGVARQVTVALSFLCAGIPSFRGTDELLAQMGVTPSEVRSLRYRGNGWPGHCTATTDHGAAELGYDESWGEVLTRFRHERCKICPDATGELADISFGDAWHSDDHGPSFEENDGRSLIFVRSELGKALLHGARDAGAVQVQAFENATIEVIQPYQAIRKRAIAARLVGRRLAGASIPHYRRLGLLRLSSALGVRTFLTEARGAAARAARSHPRLWHGWVKRILRTCQQ